MKRLTPYFLFSFAVGLLLAGPFAHASVESSLLGLKNVLLGSILPVFSVLGLGFASFSFITGNPNSKQHLIEDPKVIKKILNHMGLPSSAPPLLPARGPPQSDQDDMYRQEFYE